MDKSLFPGSLYLITDSKRCSHFELAEKALKAGCKVIQLRYKGKSSMEFYETAAKIKKLISEYSGFFIINDRADIARAVDADALHLGDEDLPIACARKICGDSMIIGLSTHNMDQVVQAEKMGADYIGLGPIYPTETKESVYQLIGTETVRKIAKRIKIPIVAIGGIKSSNAEQVLDCGADAAAVCSAIAHADDVENEVKNFIKEIEK